jgi:hypothetical protein
MFRVMNLAKLDIAGALVPWETIGLIVRGIDRIHRTGECRMSEVRAIGSLRRLVFSDVSPDPKFGMVLCRAQAESLFHAYADMIDHGALSPTGRREFQTLREAWIDYAGDNAFDPALPASNWRDDL